ncbi:MAG: STAS domain-containing protein [Myxococcales bacterium]|nr:STAS domain-containing protein [Myxococcales bacterium]
MTQPPDKAPMRIDVEGNEFLWRPERGLLLISEQPSLALWIETSLAGLMQGMQRMVGTERFNIAMQSGGRDSVAGDWGFISQFESFEVGLEKLGILANTCGWGSWSVVSLDRAAKVGRFRVINGWEALYQRALGVNWGSSMMAGKFAGLCTKLFGANCWAVQTRSQATGDDCDEFEVSPSDQTIEQKLDNLLASDKATRADLAVALHKLQGAYEERQRAEREAQERLAVIEAQRRDLDALSTPIMQIWDGVLTLPVLGALSSVRAQSMMDRLLAEIQRTQSRFAILDVTGVDMIDSHTADHLLRITRAVELLGARCVVTGIRAAVAQTIVELDSSFGGVVTLATLRDGLKYCMSALGQR